MAKCTCPVVENEQVCALPIHSYGYCSKHVQRWKRHGDPLKRAKLWRVPVEERLLAHIEYADSGCWLWTGALQKDGYGSFAGDDGESLAHRSAYKAWVGPIPGELEIDHRCRVRRCINPRHLRAITHVANIERTVRVPRTHCREGHEQTPENIRVRRVGKYWVRSCWPCLQAARRRGDQKRRGGKGDE